MITCPTCKGEFPSYPEFTAHIGNPGCANEIVAAPALEYPLLRSLTEAAEANAFHAHLEVCSQCENAPFNLCPTGTELIHSVATLLPSTSARAKCNCGATRHMRQDGTHDTRCPLYEEDNALLRTSELTAYQGGVFLILNDGRAGKRFSDEAGLELIAKHSALITDRERRRFEPLATARAIIEAEADSACEDIDSVINWLHLSRYERALIFAVRAHGEQKRRYTGEPFLVHPIAVAGILAEAGQDEDVVIAGLLHDCLEDTVITYEDIASGFGHSIACLVLEVTTSKQLTGNRATRKASERLSLSTTSAEAQSIKCADMISNIPSIVAHDSEFARIYLAEKRELLAVLTRADHNLLRRAYKVLEAGESKLAE